MASFEMPSTEAARIAHAVCGAYLMVAFSDGQYSKPEEVRLLVGLFGKTLPASVTKAELEAALPGLQRAFGADPDPAAARVLEIVAGLRSNGIAKRAVMQAAQMAVVADRKITVQEEAAMAKLAQALGVKAGEV
jgi:tellurite resistance protein